MVAEIQKRQKSNGLEKILPIAGGVVGGIYGGPAGAMAGMKLGSAVGSISNKKEIDIGDVTNVGGAAVGAMGAGDSAAMRRMNASSDLQSAPSPQPQPGDDLKQLSDARFALASQPPEVQQQYGPALTAAWLKARRQQGGMA